MTSKSNTIGEAELEIMKVLWRAGKPVNTQYINEAVEEKGWKRTTISTFFNASRTKRRAVLRKARKILLLYAADFPVGI